MGLFKVLRSCWILVDTLLFTGTPVREIIKVKNGKEIIQSLEMFYYCKVCYSLSHSKTFFFYLKLSLNRLLSRENKKQHTWRRQRETKV